MNCSVPKLEGGEIKICSPSKVLRYSLISSQVLCIEVISYHCRIQVYSLEVRACMAVGVSPAVERAEVASQTDTPPIHNCHRGKGEE